MKKNLFTLLCVTFMFMLMSSCSKEEPPIEQDPQTKFIGIICMCPNVGPNHVCKPDIPDIPVFPKCPDCGEIEGPFCCPVYQPCLECDGRGEHADWCIYAPCPVCDSYPHHTSWCDVSLCPDCGKIEGPFCCPVLWRCPDCMQAPHADWCGPCSVCGEMKTKPFCCLIAVPVCRNPETCGLPGYLTCCLKKITEINTVRKKSVQ